MYIYVCVWGGGGKGEGRVCRLLIAEREVSCVGSEHTTNSECSGACGREEGTRTRE
jgi:hypothetical protein